ncbi:hypothetical protein DFA_03592 [Cavenderia fasciculata]|uniref:Ankyrin repeat-containing protein n=1 Tax=Cavenderia fasciculata TaxID=261658 RepID=F4PI60_CACFS|nr:uncharacterized protein DFA_03592 [Cavenderia fasciculata]EGG25343.1 hypothetical protein DFA_03592 [Cavenderia fasciculata]|eukprot:XP_004363194.1 hypothetical protein DFA_03592 [Cavenderia fasciculata]
MVDSIVAQQTTVSVAKTPKVQEVPKIPNPQRDNIRFGPTPVDGSGSKGGSSLCIIHTLNESTTLEYSSSCYSNTNRIMDKKYIILLFKNIYLREQVKKFFPKPDLVEGLRVYRYDHWHTANQMLEYGYGGLLLDKINRGIVVPFQGNQAIELICEKVTDYDMFMQFYNLKRDAFLSKHLVSCAIKGGNVRIVQTLLDQITPMTVCTDNAYVMAVYHGRLDVLKLLIERKVEYCAGDISRSLQLLDSGWTSNDLSCYGLRLDTLTIRDATDAMAAFNFLKNSKQFKSIPDVFNQGPDFNERKGNFGPFVRYEEFLKRHPHMLDNRPYLTEYIRLLQSGSSFGRSKLQRIKHELSDPKLNIQDLLKDKTTKWYKIRALIKCGSLDDMPAIIRSIDIGGPEVFDEAVSRKDENAHLVVELLLSSGMSIPQPWRRRKVDSDKTWDLLEPLLPHGSEREPQRDSSNHYVDNRKESSRRANVICKCMSLELFFVHCRQYTKYSQYDHDHLYSVITNGSAQSLEFVKSIVQHPKFPTKESICLTKIASSGSILMIDYFKSLYPLCYTDRAHSRALLESGQVDVLKHYITKQPKLKRILSGLVTRAYIKYLLTENHMEMFLYLLKKGYLEYYNGLQSTSAYKKDPIWKGIILFAKDRYNNPQETDDDDDDEEDEDEEEEEEEEEDEEKEEIIKIQPKRKKPEAKQEPNGTTKTKMKKIEQPKKKSKK